MLIAICGEINQTDSPLFAHTLSGSKPFFDSFTLSDSARIGRDGILYYPTWSSFFASPRMNHPWAISYMIPGWSTNSTKCRLSPFETGMGLFQSSFPYPARSIDQRLLPQIAFTQPKNGINYKRAAVFGIGNATAISFGFEHTTAIWGKSNGRFHIKWEDWTGDHLAQIDEISHFMWGYKMTQFFFGAYQWVGLSPRTGQLLSMVESALILTAVEYPVDAYNPKQGLGVSDLIFDYMGVGLAYAKKNNNWLRNLDFKISWKRNIFKARDSAFAQTYQDYDNIIYWVTYRPSLIIHRKIVCWGLGYSTTHVGIRPERQFYLGLGLSMSDFVGLFGEKLKKSTEFLDLFYPNFKLKL